MKKSILIAITILVTSGAYHGVNAEYFDECGTVGLRHTFDGTRKMGPREDDFVGKPSPVRPDSGTLTQPPVANPSNTPTASAISTTTPTHPNKTKSGETRKYDKRLEIAGSASIMAGLVIGPSGGALLYDGVVKTGWALLGLGTILFIVGLGLLVHLRNSNNSTQA